MVMTGRVADGADWHPHIREKLRRSALAKRFKNTKDPFRIVIVRNLDDRLRRPCMHALYLDKPLAGHNLMQAIARVHRVYGEKPGGLIVDLIGLADPLADALATSANATGDSDEPIKELQDEAIPAMRSALEQLRGFFHGYDYSAALDQWHSVCDFVSGKALAAGGLPTNIPTVSVWSRSESEEEPTASASSLSERDAEPAGVLRVYLGAVDHVLDVAQNATPLHYQSSRHTPCAETVNKQTFLKLSGRHMECACYCTAFALAVPREETQEITPHLAFFTRIATMIRKRLADEAGPAPARETSLPL